VLSGTFSALAISWVVSPRTAAMTTARACSGGRVVNAVLSRGEVSLANAYRSAGQ
jgi:hypothetical protein